MAANNQRDDSPLGPILVIAACLLGVMAAWYLLQPYAAEFWIQYSKLEAYLVLATTSDEGVRYQATKLLEWLDAAKPSAVNEQMFSGIRESILGKGWHNYLLSLLLLIVAFRSWKMHQSYRGTPSLDSLIATEHRVWPALEFVRRFDPFEHWNELRGPGRYALTPFVYAAENGVIKNYKARSKKDRLFQRDIAAKVLAESLGVRFSSYMSLTPFEKALVVLVAAKYLDDKYPHYKTLLGWFAREMAAVEQSALVESLLLRVCDPIMAVLDGSQDVSTKKCLPIFADIISAMLSEQKATEKKRAQDKYAAQESTLEFFTRMTKSHAYVKTLIVGISRSVKRRGKFPPGRLVFFKPWDRHLFLILSNSPYYLPKSASPYRFVSGFFAEVIGVYAHYQHEVFAGRGLEEPFVETGVTSLRKHIARQNLIDKEG